MFTSAFRQRAPRAWQRLAVAAVMGFGTILAAGAAAAQPIGRSPGTAPGAASATLTAPSGGFYEVDHTPPGLLLRGETVTLRVGTSPGEAQVDAYVRGGSKGAFTHLKMRTADYGDHQVRVPGRLLTGSVLEEYVVVRSPAGGTPVTIPARGASAPYRSWIVDHPTTTALGTHKFGDYSQPEAIVARAAAGDGPGEVGFRILSQGTSSGPSSFEVARDGTVWVADRLNNRLLAYAPGRPGTPVRTITIPTGDTMPTAPLELAIAPRGTIYLLTAAQTVMAFRPDGIALWSVPVEKWAFYDTMRADSSGIPWIHSVEGWTPVTNRSGHPLTVAQQIAQRVPYRPIGGGRQLMDTSLYPHEERFGLVSPAGVLLQTWRVTSRDEFSSQWPQAMMGSDLVDMGAAGKWVNGRYTVDFLAVRISPTGRVLDEVCMDSGLSFGWDFTRVRVGQDGHLYYLQTSPDWGMRVARYTLRGAPAAHTSPTPQESAPPSASPAPSTSHTTAPAPVTPQTPPASSGDGGLTPMQWAGLSLGIATLATLIATAVLVVLRRRGISLHWPLHMGPHHVRPAR